MKDKPKRVTDETMSPYSNHILYHNQHSLCTNIYT